MSRRDRVAGPALVVAAVGLAFAVAAASGCGKKGAPVPPARTVAAPVPPPEATAEQDQPRVEERRRIKPPPPP